MLRLFYLGFLILLVALPPARAQLTEPKVARIEIKHVGPRNVSDDLIRANIRIKPGDVYVHARADDDVKSLYGTGLFYNIRVADERTDDGIILTYVVQAKPRLTDIKFSGNKKFGDAKLKTKISSKSGEPLDEQKLFKDTLTIHEAYQKTGYPRTEVKYTLNIDEAAGRGTVTFEITENPKAKIVAVDFVGASVFPQKKLRKEIKTRKYWFFSWLTGSGIFKQDQFEDDLERLNDFYREKGYLDFEIKGVQTNYPTPKKLEIRFDIYEGQQYKVGSVTFKGTTMFPTNKVDVGFKLKPGAVFNPKDLTKDIEAVEDFYGSKGHIDVNTSTGNLRVNRVPNTEKGTMDLEYQVEEGQKSYVEKIEIRGNTKTKDRVIRRELAISPGETFDMVRVKVSQKRLEGLQFFEKVNTRPDDTDVPNRKNLIIGVEEKNTGNVTVGAGFSSVDSLVGFAEISQGNFDLANPPTFTGGGQKMRLRVQLGTQRQDYLLSFVEPWFLDRKLQLGVDLYRRDLNFQSVNNLYDEVRTGGRVSLTRALGSDFLIGSLSFTYEQVGILLNKSLHDDITTIRPLGDGTHYISDFSPHNAPLAILNEKDYSMLARFGGSLAYDTRNSTLLPDAGQRTELTGEVVTSYLGGDRDFYKLELQSAWYVRGLFKGHVLELLARTGVADGFNGDSVPFYERYYLGGLYSLRGFQYRGISPREFDPNRGVYFSEPIGGNTYWFGSAEYSIPIIQKEKAGGVRFAIFYDIGNVSPDAFDYSGGYSDNWGFGLRLNLPIGPLRLDYGIPIRHDQFNKSTGRFQFGVGYTRGF